MPATAGPTTAAIRSRLPVTGGQYRTSETEDGYVVVHDVPLFGELPAWDRGNPEDIGRDWHERAVERADQQVEEQHLPRAFVRHHDELGIAAPDPAGFVRPHSVGALRMQGRRQSCMMGDLYLKPHIAEQIRTNDLPYLSVEISPDWDKPEVLGVALLPTEPPHFPLPMITLSDGAVAFRRDSVYVSFRYSEEGDMEGKNGMPQEKTDDVVPGTDNDKVKFESDGDESGDENTINLEAETADDDDDTKETKAMTEKMSRTIAAFERATKNLPAMVDRAVEKALSAAVDKNFAKSKPSNSGDVAKRLAAIESGNKAVAFRKRVGVALKGAAAAFRDAGINMDTHKSAFKSIIDTAVEGKRNPLPQIEAYTAAAVRQAQSMEGVRGKLPATAFRRGGALPAPIAKFAAAHNINEIKGVYADWASRPRTISFARYAELEGIDLPQSA